MTKQKWLELLNANEPDMLAILKRFHREAVEAWPGALVAQDAVALGAMLQNAWTFAPDKPWIHEIPKWHTFCDLCSEYCANDWDSETNLKIPIWTLAWDTDDGCGAKVFTSKRLLQDSLIAIIVNRGDCIPEAEALAVAKLLTESTPLEAWREWYSAFSSQPGNLDQYSVSETEIEVGPMTDLYNALNRLVDCPDLNLDELETETREALDQAIKALMSCKQLLSETTSKSGAITTADGSL